MKTIINFFKNIFRKKTIAETKVELKHTFQPDHPMRISKRDFDKEGVPLLLKALSEKGKEKTRMALMVINKKYGRRTTEKLKNAAFEELFMKTIVKFDEETQEFIVP